jgi:hypothetical protein
LPYYHFLSFAKAYIINISRRTILKRISLIALAILFLSSTYLNAENESRSKLHILSIGVDYAAFNHPDNFAEDAVIFDEILNKTNPFKETDSVIVAGEYATINNILSSISKLNEITTEKDTAILFISSHGDIRNNKFFICAYNGRLFADKIKEKLEGFKGNLIIIIDTCHSGKILSELDTENIICACKEDEVSFDPDFQLVLRSGLTQKDADYDDDGFITTHELSKYLSINVPARFNKQTPISRLGNSVNLVKL